MPETGDPVAAHNGQPVGADQIGQLARMFGQGGVQIAVGGQAQDQLVLQPAQTDPIAIQFGVGLGLQLTGQISGQGGAGDPQFIGQQQRRGAVAGDQAPQDVVDDNRHRGRGPHAHILQILDMDRRDRAQAAVAHVQRRLARRDRPQGLGRIAAVGDDPHRTAQIQGAGLAGNVGRGEMVVQEGRRAGRARLCDHLARFVVEEAVDHDPFEAGQATEGVGGAFAHGLDRGGPFQGGASGVEPCDQLDPETGLLRALFDLHHHSLKRTPAGRIVDDDVVFQPIGRAPAPGEARLTAAGHVAQAPTDDLAQQVGRRLIDPGRAAGQILDGAGALFDGLGLGIEHQQEAVGLDGLGDMDRLAIAVGEVDVRADDGFAHATDVSRRPAPAKRGGSGMSRPISIVGRFMRRAR